MTESLVRRAILVVSAATAVVAVVQPRLDSLTLWPRRTDVVAGMLVGAVALLALGRPRATRLGLWLAAAALLLWFALATHPLEGPTLYALPGDLGLGVHTGDVVLGAAILWAALVLDGQLHRGSTRTSAEDDGGGPTSSDR